MIERDAARARIVDVYARGVRALPGKDAVRVTLDNDTTFCAEDGRFFWSHLIVDGQIIGWIQVYENDGKVEVYDRANFGGTPVRVANPW